mgnify:CR=1 FL=1
MNLSPDMEARVLALADRIDGQPVNRTSEPAETVSEKAFMAEVVKLAKREGWRVYHTHDSRKSEAGFPDLVLVRERIIYAELKTATGRLTAAQSNWLEAIRDTGTSAFEWRPKDWPEIVAVLSRKA